ncbi:MAG: diadenylate cyclase CdaA [Bacteroidales bacterium]|nr:diadenylate cyclase CdaA [Bacteroidales bacterium]MBQ6576361.1 diadenylate cyclase CdaA [Bacteroidales bacterium]
MVPLELFGFLNISFTDLLDVLLVALIIYFAFRWIRESSALNIFLAIIFIYVLMVIVEALNMKLMSKLISTFIDVGVIALIVIFQPEIRHFLMKLGAGTKIGSTGRNMFNRLFGEKGKTLDSVAVQELSEACRTMSNQKTGALIVIPHEVNLNHIIETGDKIDALINRRLILNLFFKNSPLHDGAVIISGDRVVAARCTLPITERTDIPASFGMRHKAAIGISEESDADIIVVSEETGNVSFVKEGKVTPIGNMNELKLLLGAAFSQDNR